MLGIDLTRISRFKNPKKSFIDKVLHPNEIKEFEVSLDKSRFLAKRWAIKEALFKADNKYFSFNKVELKEENKIIKFPGYAISTSTEDDYYLAIVIKER